MPRTLMLMRHAKSLWKEDLADHDRPLAKRGKGDARRMGEELRLRGLVPDLIVTSSAKRARSTARRAARAMGYEGEIVRTDALYAVGAHEMLACVARLPQAAQRVLLVGHNPAMEDLCHYLCGRLLAFPTAAVAVITWPKLAWEELPEAPAGKLVWQIVPRELD